MHEPESVLENETQKLLLDFEIQTDYQIPNKRIDLLLIKRKKIIYHLADFTVQEDHSFEVKV